MRFRARIHHWLLIILLGLLIQGCVLPGMTQITPTPTPVETTIIPAATNTITPVPSPSPTQTSMPDMIPSSTPSPTDIPERVTEFVLEMLETNGDCDSPCIWGITPGETRWTELEARLTAGGLVLDGEQLRFKPVEGYYRAYCGSTFSS